MGVLLESTKEDIAALAQVAELSAMGWKAYKQGLPEEERYIIEPNDVYLTAISELGGRILEKHFENPTFLDRIATLVILSNCCHYFSLRRPNGKIVLDIDERRKIVAKLSCTLIQAALSRFAPNDGPGVYRFERFNNQTKHYRFMSFLGHMDSIEFKNTASGAKKELVDHALKMFAKDIIAVVAFLETDIEFIPEAPPLPAESEI